MSDFCVSHQGCASWNWYYPFHYAPFASDFEGIADMPSDFEKGSKPVGLLIYQLIHCWFALSFQVSHTYLSVLNSSSLLSSWWGCSRPPVETSCRQRGGNSWQTRWESLLYSCLEAQVILHRGPAAPHFRQRNAADQEGKVLEDCNGSSKSLKVISWNSDVISQFSYASDGLVSSRNLPKLSLGPDNLTYPD